MPSRSLYQRLLEVLQESQPGMVPDDPAEIARRYPQSGVPDGSYSEAQTRFPPPVDVPTPDERRLSLARFAAEALASGSVQSSSPDYRGTAPPQSAGYSSAYGAGPTLPWWAGSMLPVRGGGFAVRGTRGFGGQMPWPGPTDIPRIPMSEAWKIFGPMLTLYPELLRERLMGERDEDKVGDPAAGQILDVYQAKRPGKGSKAGPVKIQDGPSVVPDADADASAAAAADEDSSGPRENDADCEKEELEAIAFCRQAKKNGLKGFFGIAHLDDPQSSDWDFDKCVKGQMSERCGGSPLDKPDGKSKKGKKR